jgi:nucleotide-binding universal stress UspA family protein
MEKILVATDFSREAENALQTALPIAKAFNSKLIILHILEISGNVTGPNGMIDATKASNHLREEVERVKESMARSRKLHDIDSLSIEYEELIRVGTASKQLEQFINDEHIDFVVMGTKSAWGLNDILLGTTTDKLLRRVNCPVLSVNKVIPTEAFKKIVLHTTTLRKESKLIASVKLFQRLFNSKIYLLRINTPMNFLPDKDSVRLLDNYARENELTNYESYVYSHTLEEDGIRDFAEIKNAGLIAISTSAHTGLRKIIQGSVTKELVSHSTRPVLSVKIDNR